MANIQQYAARGVWDPPTYSQAVKVTGGETILYIAGQVAYDGNGNAAHAGDFKAQARAALQAVKAQVEAGGGTMANIVKGKKMPASTLVAVAALAQPEFLIEIEAVAVI